MESELKSYTRVVSTEDGGSAFEDAELHLSEQELVGGVPAMLFGALAAANGVGFARLAAFHSEPHPAAGEQWVIVLRGVIEVQVGDWQTRRTNRYQRMRDTAALGSSGLVISLSPPTPPRDTKLSTVAISMSS